jgi:predicted esterase
MQKNCWWRPPDIHHFPNMRTISIETSTHGRVLIKDAGVSPTNVRFLVGFHGYAQDAEDMLAELDRLPGSDAWTRVSIQALHRFYSRGNERVVASWMTRQDRELAIADNIVYVDRVVRSLVADAPQAPVVFVGFSQGVAMAYRAGVLGAYRARGVIAIGGDIPPDVKTSSSDKFPSVLVAAGESDRFYPPAKVEADEAFMGSVGVQFDVFRYQGGHEWTDALRDRIHQALDQIVRGRPTF